MENDEQKQKTIEHKNGSLARLDMSFSKHIEKAEYKTSDLLAYWIKDFSQYHDEEKIFNPATLRKFKKGSIIKVNLGFNIGNELGGLHYCVVINKNDSTRSGTLNVIPLSSYKEKGFNHKTSVDLKDELYKALYNNFIKKLDSLEETIKIFSLEPTFNKEEFDILSKKHLQIKKMLNELSRMKTGSIALVNQITTISKQRIFKTTTLEGVRLSNKTLDILDEKIKQIFLKNSKY